MFTEVLEKCTMAIYKSSLKTYSGLHDLYTDFRVPFYKELTINMIDKETINGKKTVIEHYIKCFPIEQIEWMNIFYNELPTEKKGIKIIISFLELEKQNPDFTPEEIEILKELYLINELFKIIQISCVKYNIKFFELCNEIGFPLEHIDCSTAQKHFNSIEGAKEPAKLTLKMIALKYVYENKYITKENCNDIAKQFGYNSGQKLYQEFTIFIKQENRKGEPKDPTAKKYKNKIELIQSVINILDDSYKPKAIDELNILSSKYENEY